MRIGTLWMHFGVAALVAAGAVGARDAQAAAVFTDTFGTGSTLNQASAPNSLGTQTSYDLVSAKAVASSIGAGDLKNSITTSSAFSEAQALFTTSPVTLGTVGDFIQVSLTFNTSTMLIGTADTSDIGLYNSGGVAPLTPAANSTAAGGSGSSSTANFVVGSATDTIDVTNGVAKWAGYVGKSTSAGGTNRIVTRPDQTLTSTNTTNSNQDLTGGPGTGGFNTDTILASSTSTGNTTAATLYTETFTITLSAVNTLTISDLLTSVGGASDSTTATVVGTVAAPLVTTFDGLAFGFRHSGASGTSGTMDAASLTVTDSIAGAITTPEPASLGVLAIGGLALLIRRRKA